MLARSWASVSQSILDLERSLVTRSMVANISLIEASAVNSNLLTYSSMRL
ncbi:MAG: hypothetical protein ACJAVV_000178 [Alphaproteobacteria bacterium]|jgi:hypothetical protein